MQQGKASWHTTFFARVPDILVLGYVLLGPGSPGETSINRQLS
jgi:hypothetical protein